MTELIPEDPATYDLSYLDDPARDALRRRFRADGIDFVWEGTTVHVAGVDEGVAFARIAEAGSGSLAFRPEELPTFVDPRPEEPLASGWRRIAGYMIDGWISALLAGVVAFSTIRIHGRGLQPFSYRLGYFAITTGVTFLVVARPTARRGRSLGMLAAGTRLVRIDTGRSPGYRVATVRWAVTVLAGTTTLLPVEGAARSALNAALVLAVYLPIRLRRDHRGLHDVIAGTVVVYDGFEGVPPLPA